MEHRGQRFETLPPPLSQDVLLFWATAPVRATADSGTRRRTTPGRGTSRVAIAGIAEQWGGW